MKAVLDFLNGKKTYIVVILMFVASGGMAVGWWDMKAVQMADMFLIPLGLGFLRAGVTKSGPLEQK
jgi:DNA-binding transcriptional regulator of glucitol operon